MSDALNQQCPQNQQQQTNKPNVNIQQNVNHSQQPPFFRQPPPFTMQNMMMNPFAPYFFPGSVPVNNQQMQRIQAMINKNSIQQVLLLVNTGSSPLMMKTRATYLYGCQPITTDNTLNQIF